MKEVPPDPPQELLGKRIFGVAFAHPKVFLYPHGDVSFGQRANSLDPLFALDSTNLGGKKPPMSIEAVVHAEDAGNRVYDSVGTL